MTENKKKSPIFKHTSYRNVVIGLITGLLIFLFLAYHEMRQYGLAFTAHNILNSFQDANFRFMMGGLVIVNLGFIALLYMLGTREEKLDQINKNLEQEVATRTQEAIYQGEYYRSLVEHTPLAVVSLDLEANVVSCNPAFERMFGFTFEEAAGKNVVDLVVPESQLAHAMEVGEVLASDGNIEFEGMGKTKTGEIVQIVFRGVQVYMHGDRIGSLGLYEDISERKEAQQQLIMAKEKAEEATKAKADFLSNMSHEIRTPLNAIVGMTGLLLDTELDAEQEDYVETIRSGSDSLLVIINDILDFSKIEAGKMDLEVQPFYVRDCVESALDLLVSKATERGLELAYMIADDVPPVVLGDITRLRQILVNLVSNAVKFTSEGEVVVSVDRVGCDEKDCTLKFSVRDTGIGIPEDRLNRLFEAFSQVDSSTTRKFGGTGLGLSISKQLSNLMGGEIWVESEVNKGSTFSFTIYSEVDPNAVPKLPPNSNERFDGRTILLVDDNATNRTILEKQTASWGMQPTAVESGPEALALLLSGQNFDLAILDMQMPDMDGFTLAMEIRKLRDEAQMPLLMLTSMGRDRAREEDVKFAAFMSKPIKPSVLFETLHEVLMDKTVVIKPARQEALFDATLAKQYPLKILLAEDNLVNQKVATSIFGKLGYRIDVAANGIEAITSLSRQPYDVIFMDIQMPEMDGVEATARIREQWPADEVPKIIAMTAHALEGDQDKYLSLGMDGYISKPVKVDALIEAIKSVKTAVQQVQEAKNEQN